MSAETDGEVINLNTFEKYFLYGFTVKSNLA